MKFIRISHFFVLAIAVVIGMGLFTKIRGRYSKIDNIDRAAKTQKPIKGEFRAGKYYDPDGVLEPIVVTEKKREYKPVDHTEVEKKWMNRLYSSEFFDKSGEVINEEARLLEAKKCADKGYRSCIELLNQLEQYWKEPKCNEFSTKFGFYIASKSYSQKHYQAFEFKGQRLYFPDQPVFNETFLKELRLREGHDGRYSIMILLKKEGQKLLETATAQNSGQYACFVVDDIVLTCPYIVDKISLGRMTVSLNSTGMDGRENQLFNEICYKAIARPLPY